MHVPQENVSPFTRTEFMRWLFIKIECQILIDSFQFIFDLNPNLNSDKHFRSLMGYGHIFCLNDSHSNLLERFTFEKMKQRLNCIPCSQLDFPFCAIFHFSLFGSNRLLRFATTIENSRKSHSWAIYWFLSPKSLCNLLRPIENHRRCNHVPTCTNHKLFFPAT